MSDEAVEVEVVRSARRKSTVSARFEQGKAVVRVPAGLPKAQEKQIVDSIVAKLVKKHASSLDNDALAERAERLNETILDGRGTIGSIRWVTNQQHRWGSCTRSTGAIRISSRLKIVPDYVLDAVIVHEIVHTFIAGHGPEFYQWADRVPYAERARGYLEAFQRFGADS